MTLAIRFSHGCLLIVIAQVDGRPSCCMDIRVCSLLELVSIRAVLRTDWLSAATNFRFRRCFPFKSRLGFRR